MKEVLQAFGRGTVRLFRSNAGVSWQGKEVEHTARFITLENPRAIHGWPAGTSDLVGWKSVVITQAMVGSRVAVFTAVEVKSPGGRLTDGQRRFLAAVQAAGGYAVAARTLAEVAAVLGEPAGPASERTTAR